MKKTTKGAIAAGAAAVLLLGGAGTLAFWSDSEPIDAGAIESGNLTLEVAPGTWADETPGTTTGALFDPATDLIVPGDVITYTTAATVSGIGKNLEATFSAVLPPESGTLAPYVATVLTVDGETDGGDSLVFDFEDGDTQTFPVVVTFTFDPATAGLDGQDSTLDLASFQLLLAQTPNGAVTP
ncbi:alternate-type signal peptide domain-containing protein [Rathayibacter sp. VKM Ac-2835]|uniref:alternate-type signal peptide domain-containing protein n=1 Tax=Rathayibacter sp. VKM Ac-2835 TaxID=2739043 RepID=UPI0015651F4B|nr:alternate-type signal peptide domain-containing protein [Rathayibacter sp. VKM Ac-2835]NRG41028.1 alternate-type signal peptide domain-containing protein [Rathayibacter sp. VKM Ac-2835]